MRTAERVRRRPKVSVNNGQLRLLTPPQAHTNRITVDLAWKAKTNFMNNNKYKIIISEMDLNQITKHFYEN